MENYFLYNINFYFQVREGTINIVQYLTRTIARSSYIEVEQYHRRCILLSGLKSLICHKICVALNSAYVISGAFLTRCMVELRPDIDVNFA